MSKVMVQMPEFVPGTNSFFQTFQTDSSMIHYRLFGRDFYQIFVFDGEDFQKSLLLTKVNDVFVHFPVHFERIEMEKRFFNSSHLDSVPVMDDTFPNGTILLGQPISLESFALGNTLGPNSKYVHHLYVPILDTGSRPVFSVYTRTGDASGYQFVKDPYISYSVRTSLENYIPGEIQSEHRIRIPEGEVVSIPVQDGATTYRCSVYMAPGIHDYCISYFPVSKEEMATFSEMDELDGPLQPTTDEEWNFAFQKVIEKMKGREENPHNKVLHLKKHR